MTNLSPILVTGASGLLGANLVLTLRERGESVIAISNTHAVRGEGIKTYQIDLTDSAAARQLVEREQPCWVVHCAANTNLDNCQAHPDEALRSNADMACIMAEAAHKTGAHFLYISTDAVFDGTKGNYKEEDAPNPINNYAKSKWGGEKMVANVSPDCLIARVNIYGWNMQNKQSLAEWMLAQLEKSAPFSGFRDVVFNPLLVNDLSDILIKMMGASLHGIFHLGSNNSCSKYEFGRKLAEIFGFDVALVQPSSSEAVAFKTPRPKVTTLNIDKIEKALGIKMPGIEQGLKRLRQLREDGMLKKLKQLGEK